MPPLLKRSALFAKEMRQAAKERGKDLAKTIEFWFRKKYSLTEHDPRFLEMTVEEMLADYWAHHYHDNPNAGQEEYEDPDFEEEMRRLQDNPDEWETLS